MKTDCDLLLEKFDLDSKQNYLLIFDIDGTLRPDDIEALDHRHPKIPVETAQKIQKINLHERVDVAILTARSYIDIFKSNFPKDIIKYCGCGKQILDNEILRYPREEFRKSYDETVMFIDILQDIFGKELVSKIDFLVVPGDFAIYFHEMDYQKSKEEVMEKIDLVMENSKRWVYSDMGKEIIFLDNHYQYDKGDAIKDILENTNHFEPLNVFMFGDSSTDAQAMISLKELQKDNSTRRIKGTNISIGELLKGEEFVDFSFESYHDTKDFINRLHEKLFQISN